MKDVTGVTASNFALTGCESWTARDHQVTRKRKELDGDGRIWALRAGHSE
jgi:hypothetical protein